MRQHARQEKRVPDNRKSEKSIRTHTARGNTPAPFSVKQSVFSAQGKRKASSPSGRSAYDSERESQYTSGERNKRLKCPGFAGTGPPRPPHSHQPDESSRRTFRVLCHRLCVLWNSVITGLLLIASSIFSRTFSLFLMSSSFPSGTFLGQAAFM